MKKRFLQTTTYNSLYVASILLTILVFFLFFITLVGAFLPLKEETNSVNFFAIGKVLWFTVKQAFLSTCVALLVGLPMAYFLACKKFFGKKFFSSLSSVSLCIPPLIMALGYVMTFGMNGAINQFLVKIFGLSESPLTFLYSFWGIVIVHGFYNFPVIMGTVSESWKNLPEDKYFVAQLAGATRFKTFKTVTLPGILPAIASSSIIVFLYCFFSFVIVLLFGTVGCSTLEVEIYQAAKNTLDFSYAAKLALLETFTALAFVFLYVSISKKSRLVENSATSNKISPKNFSSLFGKIFFAITICAIFLFLILPLILIFIKGFSKYPSLFKKNSFWEALKNTIFTGFFTGLFSSILALVYSLFSRKIDPLKKSTILKTLPLLPMAVSSVVLGFGIINFSTFIDFSPSKWILILIQTSLAWPFALQQIQNPLEKISLDVTNAATLLSKNPLDVIFKVILPQLKKPVFIAFGFAFAISAGDASLPLILGIHNFETLALYTYRLASSYKFAEACSCGSILIIIGITVFAFASQKSNLQKRKIK